MTALMIWKRFMLAQGRELVHICHISTPNEYTSEACERAAGQLVVVNLVGSWAVEGFRFGVAVVLAGG